MTEKKSKYEIVIYKPPGAAAEVKVRLKEDAVWLTLNQIADLFERDKSVISRHFKNIFGTKELTRRSVVAKNATTAADGKVYKVDYYNLDAILSVGYRVNSKRGTQFRIWATKVLKEHIVRGFSTNEARLKEEVSKFRELQKAVSAMAELLESHDLKKSEAVGLLKVITEYSYALEILDKYDRRELALQKITQKKEFQITPSKARGAIRELGEKFRKAGENAGFFAVEKDKSFDSSILSIYQTFGGKALYPSIEEKGAHLLYFVIKNHSFIDGNKRIAAFLFVWFLNANKILFRKNGERRIADNALVALTLMTAESKPKDRDIIIKLIVNLINRDN